MHAWLDQTFILHHKDSNQDLELVPEIMHAVVCRELIEAIFAGILAVIEL